VTRPGHDRKYAAREGGPSSVPLDLPALRRRLPQHPRTRFAPAPTGYLHLGHAVNAVFVWGLARALGGRVLLRIEDHDRGRSRPEYERALLEDLAWLGLAPDEGPVRQSDDAKVYVDQLRSLAAHHEVYACDCSRKQLGTGPYSGRCRSRGLVAGPGLGVRVRLEDEVEQFDDALLGRQVQQPLEQCGDLLLRDRLGNWTYQFAVVVDDLRQGIDLVIRGADLLDSTGRQLALRRMLGGGSAPVFAHHPLLLKPGGAKLSKASRDTGLRDLRRAGWTAGRVLGEAAHRGGLLPHARQLEPGALARLFTSQPGP
jgi:glutamyl-tRNA synthetase/glutamyl-Q tRNA(Asp) synthetase